jgi:hypothetical protein
MLSARKTPAAVAQIEICVVCHQWVTRGRSPRFGSNVVIAGAPRSLSGNSNLG